MHASAATTVLGKELMYPRTEKHTMDAQTETEKHTMDTNKYGRKGMT